jgi:GR25 family glycosyltransferase involved in LPS biosynthesis
MFYFLICCNVVQAAILTGQSTTINGTFNLYTSTTTTVVVTSGGTTTTGAVVTSGGTTATTVVVTSGGTGSYSPYPSTTASAGGRRRRRRSVIQSTHINSHMPIGGCLVIGLEKSNINYIQSMHKQYAFVKHLPLGIEPISSIDGQQIDLYTFLRENKFSKSIYNQLVIQNYLINGHNLTLGALGCLESHVRAWGRVVEVDRPMLILEDDTHFEAQLFDYILPYLLYSLPTNFSLFYFGNLVGENIQSNLIDYNDLLWKINGANWGTYAYLISPQAAATLLDFIYPVQAQVDSMIIDIAQSQSFDVFMSKQILVKTDNTYGRLSRTQRYLIPPITIPRIFHFI